MKSYRQIAFLHLHWWPVGQGLYSSGVIRTLSRSVFSWVYDCGTSSSHNLIDNALEIDRLGVKKIDLVVLSHFYKDHISGFSRLIAAYPIKWLLIPYILLWKRLVLAIEQGVSTEDSTFQFFLNSVTYLRGIKMANIDNIVFVPAGEPDDEASVPDDPDPPILSEGDEAELTWLLLGTGTVPNEAVGDPAVEQHQQGKKLVFLKPGSRIVSSGFWEFVPYNDAEQQPKADDQFMKKAESLLELVKNDASKRNQEFEKLRLRTH